MITNLEFDKTTKMSKNMAARMFHPTILTLRCFTFIAFGTHLNHLGLINESTDNLPHFEHHEQTKLLIKRYLICKMKKFDSI